MRYANYNSNNGKNSTANATINVTKTTDKYQGQQKRFDFQNGIQRCIYVQYFNITVMTGPWGVFFGL